MRNRNLNELVGLAPAKKSPASHPGYQRAGSYDCPQLKVSPTLSRAVARHQAYHYTPSHADKRFARFLVVQGLPGEGKTEGVRIACSRLGVDVIISGPSEFAGETENAGSAALGKVEDAIKAISAREGRPFALVLDDFDMSIASRLGHTEYTVNSQLLTGALQHLCDTGGMRDASGTPVAIVMTGNDFTTMRSSLLRPGRAIFYEHALSYEEKCDMVAALFNVDTKNKALRALVWAYRNEPLAFFSELRARAIDEDLDSLIDHYGLDVKAIESELVDTAGAIDLARIHQLAATAVKERAVSFLKERR